MAKPIKLNLEPIQLPKTPIIVEVYHLEIYDFADLPRRVSVEFISSEDGKFHFQVDNPKFEPKINTYYAIYKGQVVEIGPKD